MRTVLSAAIALAFALTATAAQAEDSGKPRVLDESAEMAGIALESKLLGHSVYGGGYAAFDVDGAPGDNSYWVFAQGIGRLAFGRWYADVYIDFGGFIYDFEAMYTVDCVEVDQATRQAWIDGTIIESNNPANIGLRAFLWLKDGGPDGEDFHAITPLAEGVDCRQRPAPDFMERAQSGNYVVRR